MRFDPNYRSSRVNDRRGEGPAGGGLGGGAIGLLFVIFRRFGIVGVLVAIGIFAAVSYLGGGGGRSGLAGQDGQPLGTAEEEEMVGLVSFVLDDAQSMWNTKFQEAGSSYQYAELDIFTGRVDSACGLAGAAIGPFYCRRDHKVYIDLSFYQALRNRLGAPGDFAQAYVIAHEVGHHVQALRGELSNSSEEGADKGSVRAELQADCYAGVWAASAQKRNVLEPGDLEEALRAAQAIGDDTLQQQSSGTVQPESWTHGSSAQRMRWFQRGFEGQSFTACDTQTATNL